MVDEVMMTSERKRDERERVGSGREWRGCEERVEVRVR